MGADVIEYDDGLTVSGGRKLRGAHLDCFGDHRIAMMNGVAGLVSSGTTTILDSEVASVSYPSFWETLGNI